MQKQKQLLWFGQRPRSLELPFRAKGSQSKVWHMDTELRIWILQLSRGPKTDLHVGSIKTVIHIYIYIYI